MSLQPTRRGFIGGFMAVLGLAVAARLPLPTPTPIQPAAPPKPPVVDLPQHMVYLSNSCTQAVWIRSVIGRQVA